MKNLNFKDAVISAIIIYVLGVTAFTSSFLLPILPDATFQANVFLMIAIIPAALLGEHIYYRKDHHTNGFLLGTFLFLIAMLLDALITVPLFIIPNGGNHLTFFADPYFWLIAVIYVLTIVGYWSVQKNQKGTEL